MKDFHNLPDEELLSEVKVGNELAFKQLYYKYWEGLYSATLNVLDDKGHTEDVLHEVFTTIWTRRKTLKITHLKSYLYAAVRNKAFKKIKNSHFLEFHEQILSEMASPAKIELEYDERDLYLRVEKYVQELPARCRAIFYMSRYQNYSNTEIATHFNISQRTVENQLYLATKHLRGKLGEALPLVLFFGPVFA
ncbi:MAG: RNA polymerase sigma-70 factor [Bacteroidota bacterium]